MICGVMTEMACFRVGKGQTAETSLATSRGQDYAGYFALDDTTEEAWWASRVAVVQKGEAGSDEMKLLRQPDLGIQNVRYDNCKFLNNKSSSPFTSQTRVCIYKQLLLGQPYDIDHTNQSPYDSHFSIITRCQLDQLCKG